jgi:transposase
MVCCGLDGVQWCTPKVHEVSAMSMRPRPSHAVPALTAQVAQAAFPKGCLAIRVRDALGELFEDEEFEGLFVVRGRPALSPARLALVSVLQFAEGLPDRQAADAVRSRIDWKYALGPGADRHRL